MTSRVGERGQITIEKAIREELAIYAGDETIQRVEDGRIVIEVVPGRHRRSLAGTLRDKVGRVPDDETWDTLRDAAWRHPGSRPTPVIGLDTSVIVRYLVGSPAAQAAKAARLIDDDTMELGVSPVALAECAHVLRTQYDVGQRDIIDSLIAFVQRANVRVLGQRTDVLVEALVRARGPARPPDPGRDDRAASLAADAIPLATFDRDQRRYGIEVRGP